MSRVVITGLSMSSCLGLTLSQNWNSICAKFSGIKDIQSSHVSRAGKITEDVYTDFSSMRLQLTKSFHSSLSLTSAIEALNDANYYPDTESERSSTGVMESLFAPNEQNEYLKSGAFTACNIATAIGLKGPISSSAGSLPAIFEACQLIAQGETQLMIVFGTSQELTEGYLEQLSSKKILNTSKEYNFLSGQGITLGEGSGALILESLDHAKARDARIYAEVTDYSQVGCEELGVSNMNRLPNEGDVVIPSASGINNADMTEVDWLKRCKMVFSSKPNTGWMPSAAGITDCVIASLILQQAIIPPVMSKISSTSIVTKLTQKTISNVGIVDVDISGSASYIKLSKCLD